MEDKKRYYEIDVARAIVMFVAVIIHSGGVYSTGDLARTVNTDRTEFFQWLNAGLNLFVSPTFMIVGGFFSILLLNRYGPIDFIKKRTLRLGLPVLSIGISFGLYETYMRFLTRSDQPDISFFSYLFSHNFTDDLAQGRWLHQTWFLVVIIICIWLIVLLNYISSRLIKKRDVFIRATQNGLSLLSDLKFNWLVVSLAMAFIQWLITTATSYLSDSYYSPIVIIYVGFVSLHQIVFFLFFFLFGIFLSLSPKFYNSITEWRPFLIVTALLCVVLTYSLGQSFKESGWLGQQIYYFIWFTWRWITSIAFLVIMRRYFQKKPHGLIIYLVDSAMTVYLVHHSMVYFLGDKLSHVSWPITLEFFILIVLAVLGAFLFHFIAVYPFQTMRLILNGQTKGANLSVYSGLLRIIRGRT